MPGHGEEGTEVHSAQKLQAVFRGHRSRRKVGWKKAALTKLQAVYRGHMGRYLVQSHLRHRRVAMRLQAAYRGHLSRTRVRNQVGNIFDILRERQRPRSVFERLQRVMARGQFAQGVLLLTLLIPTATATANSHYT
mmetsp:Transcript_32856/g.51229  ORF Transcript_32856/g.51229 Transcript_32856/m.51229 type:complete len:136 (-) Transcript_32856:509-916(-)